MPAQSILFDHDNNEIRRRHYDSDESLEEVEPPRKKQKFTLKNPAKMILGPPDPANTMKSTTMKPASNRKASSYSSAAVNKTATSTMGISGVDVQKTSVGLARVKALSKTVQASFSRSQNSSQTLDAVTDVKETGNDNRTAADIYEFHENITDSDDELTASQVREF